MPMEFFQARLALLYLTEKGLRSDRRGYASPEEMETAELLEFIKLATAELHSRGVYAAGIGPSDNMVPPLGKIRIGRNLDIYVGDRELKVRPMAKAVLLLFLKYPEGIVLKEISAYKEDLAFFYRRLSRSDSPKTIQMRLERLLDICYNDLNVNISRANAALSGVFGKESGYRIKGDAGKAKALHLPKDIVVWEE